LYHRSRAIFWLVVACAALYALFTFADAPGVGYSDGALFGATPIPSDWLKYASICVCLAISVAVARRTPYARDARHQVAIFLFTLVADFFILFTSHYAAGVLVFCGAHLIAINRYAGRGITKRMAVIAGASAAALALIAVIYVHIYPTGLPHAGELYHEKPGGVEAAGYYFELISYAIYAMLITAATVTAFRRRQARVNNILSRLGMTLFLLCDVNVLLWNMLRWANQTWIPGWTVTLIWTFYLPGQTMLALSAYDFGDNSRKG
jgi:hypothetical protein